MVELITICGLALGSICQTGSPADSLPKRYDVMKTQHKIQIDGKVDKVWKKAAWTSYFQDIEGSKKPVPRFKTRVKMLWD
ncbi:MAG: hypothetical protein KAF40_11180, partial [Flavihumibacter sp.]|nr:hypothetical protein [Flavihumibacter sp.]